MAYTPIEVSMALKAIKARRSRGTDLTVGHPRFVTNADEFTEAASEGVVFMHTSEQLSTGFMFIKLDAGRSFFRKAESRVCKLYR